MNWTGRLSRRLRLLFHKDDVESELAEEVRLHVEMEVEELVRNGMDPASARHEAHRRLGGVERTKEWVRHERGGRVLEDLLTDVSYALRNLRRAPGFAATAIVMLAVGIGANTALFTAVNELLFVKVSVADPDGLVRLRWAGENDMVNRHEEWGYSAETAASEPMNASFSVAMFEQLTAVNQTLTGLLASAPAPRLNVSVDGEAVIASGLLVSGMYFNLLGVHPELGRLLGAADDSLSAPPVAMISHAFWAGRFGFDPSVVGRLITVNGVAVTIVGVLPGDYTGIRRPGDVAAEIHLPLAHHPPFTSRGDQRRRPTWSWVQILGRLRPGRTAEQVQGNLEGPFQTGSRAAMAVELAALPPASRAMRRNRGGTAVGRLHVDSAARGIYDPDPDAARQAVLLAVVVLLVLLVVCANVGNLLLSRATARQRELAVRLSVGATRGRLVRQLVTESLVLSGIGGSLGVFVALAARDWLPFGKTASFDWRVCAFILLAIGVSALLFGVAPAVRATSGGLSNRLRTSSQAIGGSGTWLAKGLLVAQVAVSLVLVVGAGLFLRTLGNLRAVDVGFEPANILLFRVDPSLNAYDDERQAILYDRLTQSIRSVPGVVSASHSTVAFLTGNSLGDAIYLDGSGIEGGFRPHVLSVSPEFFETMEIPVLLGRGLDVRDGPDAQAVVVINQTAAREFFGDDNPLGRRLGTSPLSPDRAEIVGVVRDVKYAEVRGAVPPTVFWPFVQESYGAGYFAVRTAGPPEVLTTAVRDAVRRVDPNLPLMDVSTQVQQIEGRLAQERLFAFAYALFGGLAMALAAVGLFGVVSYGVARRTNEIGIRMALGAERAAVKRMVLGESLVLVGVGVSVGVAGVFATGRLVTSLLFGVAPTDVATILQAVGVMVVVAGIAGYLPARRAARVDPLVAIRCE
jgi:predicted permease